VRAFLLGGGVCEKKMAWYLLHANTRGSDGFLIFFYAWGTIGRVCEVCCLRFNALQRRPLFLLLLFSLLLLLLLLLRCCRGGGGGRSVTLFSSAQCSTHRIRVFVPEGVVLGVVATKEREVSLRQ
ncbi:unnamed protein product, partial [Hapterophycus canaliculatus]